MRARNAYELTVTRGREADQVEIVEIASGEVILFWDSSPRETAKLVRKLREDLIAMDDVEFLAVWQRYSL